MICRGGSDRFLVFEIHAFLERRIAPWSFTVKRYTPNVRRGPAGSPLRFPRPFDLALSVMRHERFEGLGGSSVGQVCLPPWQIQYRTRRSLARYLQTGPASFKNVPLFENHPLTPMDGAP